MIGITEISAVVAAAGVLVGVAYYVLDLRHEIKMRHTDLVMRLSSYVITREFIEATSDVINAEYQDYNDFVKKYGEPFSKESTPISFIMIGSFCEQLGVLHSNRLIDISLIEQLFTVPELWEKMKPVIVGLRNSEHNETYFKWFECLYNEMKNREVQE